MKLKLYFLGFLLTLLISGCEETIILDVRQTPPRLVIEGLVTDQVKHQVVRLRRTVSFYSEGPSPGVAGALVEVTDSEGNTFAYVHNPRNHPDSVGIYLSENPYAAELNMVGGEPDWSNLRTYQLQVILDGEIYTATDELRPVSDDFTVSYRLDTDRAEDEDEEDIYEVLYTVTEPQDSKDFYQFRIYRNDTISNADGSELYYADDTIIGEEIVEVPAPGFYALQDTVRAEVYSISRAMYNYYLDSDILINSDGGMFSPPPANPRNNWDQEVLGYFQVSSVISDEVIIE